MSTTVNHSAASARTLVLPAAGIPRLDIAAWRDDLRRRLRSAQQRVLTLYGRKVGSDVVITAVLQRPDMGIEVTRTVTSGATGYPALTPEIGALHTFERELHEQTGIALPGHNWLKPIRYEGQTQDAMKGYPWYRLEGKEVHEVAVGPVHAGVIEPGSFRFSCHGERVHHLEIHLGYQHRGVEAMLLRGDPRRLAPLVETIAGDTSIGHAWAYSAAIEALAGCQLPIPVDWQRALMLEFERFGIHLASLSGLAVDIGFLQAGTSWGRMRTTAINTSMRLCGSRFGRSAMRPGGARIELPDDLRADMHKNLTMLIHDFAAVEALWESAATVSHRFVGVGTVTTALAREIGLVGLMARSCGIATDQRHGAGGAYGEAPMPVCTVAEGDCMARGRVRIAEVNASLRWLQQNLDRVPAGTIPLAPIGELARETLAVAVVEGVRGEVVHCLETDGRGALLHYKAQDPSIVNWFGLAQAVRNNEIYDFPLCNKSFDLSYCGNDL